MAVPPGCSLDAPGAPDASIAPAFATGNSVDLCRYRQNRYAAARILLVTSVTDPTINGVRAAGYRDDQHRDGEISECWRLRERKNPAPIINRQEALNGEPQQPPRSDVGKGFFKRHL